MSKGKKKKNKKNKNNIGYKKAIKNDRVKENSNDKTTVKKSTALYIAIGFLIFALSSTIKTEYYSILVSIGGLFIMLLGVYDSFKFNKENKKGSFNYYFYMGVGILFTLYLLYRIYVFASLIATKF